MGKTLARPRPFIEVRGSKALTVAIAGALAAPRAAQAVDFTISGRINRALVIRDTDASTKATVEDNGESDTRIRANGSTELDDGSTIAIQFEYGVGGSYDRNASHASDAGVTPLPGVTTADDGAGGTGVYLRHANVRYRGTFGAFTLGQGSEAGDGSQYAGVSGVTGLAHGSKTLYGDYFGSLDSGARVCAIQSNDADEDGTQCDTAMRVVREAGIRPSGRTARSAGLSAHDGTGQAGTRGPEPARSPLVGRASRRRNPTTHRRVKTPHGLVVRQVMDTSPKKKALPQEGEGLKRWE